MGKTIKELKDKLILRVFFERSQHQKIDDYKFAKSLIFQLRNILEEENIKNISIRFCRNRIFLIFSPNGRIICELGIDGRDVYFVNLKGIIPDNRVLADIVNEISKLSARKRRAK